MAEDFQRAMKDPVYFVDTFCWTFDPRPEAYPHHLPFKLYDFQKEYILWLVDHIKKGRDCFTDKSRDMGASWLVLSVVVWFWLFEPGFQALIGSRKEDLVDDGTLASLFGKIAYLIEKIPFAPESFEMKKHRTYLKLVNPMNGNTISGESANANFSRQGRYRVILLDEGAFWENLQSAWASAGDAAPCRCLITTPPEQPNFAKFIRFSGKTDVYVLNWKDHPKKTKEWYEQEVQRRTPEEIARELDNNWEGAITGRYYPEYAHIRRGSFPYRPDWPLYVSHDPGHNPDPHATLWAQVDPESGRLRIIEAAEFYRKIADWFLPMWGHPIDSTFAYTPEDLALIEKVRNWKRGIHYGDLYGETDNQVTGTSVYDAWRVERDNIPGVFVQSRPDAVSHAARSKATRELFVKGVDLNDTPGCNLLYECLKDARLPQLSESNNRVTPNTKPVHNWTSHLRSALEYLAVNLNWTPNERHLEGDTFGKALASVQSSNNSSNDVIS